MALRGAVAEWLGRGLQSLVQRFESARRLSRAALQGFFFSFRGYFSRRLRNSSIAATSSVHIVEDEMHVGVASRLDRRVAKRLLYGGKVSGRPRELRRVRVAGVEAEDARPRQVLGSLRGRKTGSGRLRLRVLGGCRRVPRHALGATREAAGHR